jgi:hypothetical protein
MKGLEPSTFLHGKCRPPFAPFARTGGLHEFPCKRANTTEPEANADLAILATVSRQGLTRRPSLRATHASSQNYERVGDADLRTMKRHRDTQTWRAARDR